MTLEEKIAEQQRLKAEQERIDQEIAELVKTQRADKIAAILADITMFKINREELFPAIKLAPKYKNPDDGATYSGKGPQPKWLKDKIAQGCRLDDFLIVKPEALAA